jgi:hypothetical protein
VRGVVQGVCIGRWQCQKREQWIDVVFDALILSLLYSSA